MHRLSVSRHVVACVIRTQGVLQRRAFLSPTATLRADMVQDLYLRELKNYKLTPLKPTDADTHVQKFKKPKVPLSPEESDIARELKAYEAQHVDVEGQSTSGEEEQEDWDWFEEDPEWEDYYRKEEAKDTSKTSH